MPQYVITNVTGPREWTGQHGPMVDYNLTIEGRDKTAILTQQPKSPPPVLGPMELDIVDHPSEKMRDRFDKAKKTAPPGGFVVGARNGGGREKDPVERRSIAMQASQKVAVDILRIAQDLPDYKKPTSGGELAHQVQVVAALLWKQVMDAENDTTANTGAKPS